MVRTFRFAMGTLLIGAGLLLPVLLRGQVPGLPPSQPWGPGVTESTSRKPSIIATTTPPTASEMTAPRPMPLPDDGLSTPITFPRSTGPVARGVDASPARTMPQLNPQPLPQVSGPLQLVAARTIAGAEPFTVATTPGTSNTPPLMTIGALSPAASSSVSVEILGPARVTLEDLLPCEIVVRNVGPQVLTNVRIDLPLPNGLRFVTAVPMPETHADRLVWNLGVLEVRGERRLRTDLMVRAADDMALQPQASFQLGAAYRPQVVRPAFAVQQVGPDVVPRGMTTTLQLQLTNNGPTPLNKVVLWDRLPAGLYHPQGAAIFAEVGQLAPGESRVVKLDVLAQRSGRWINEVSAAAEGGAKALSRAAILIAEPNRTDPTVLGEGGCRLGLVVESRQDPLEVGGETVYEIRLSNLGAQPGRNVRLSAWVPEGLLPVRAEGPTGVRIQQQLVQFETVPEIETRSSCAYRMRVRGQRAGAWRLRIEALAEQMARPLAEELGVTVVPDPRTQRPTGSMVGVGD